MEGQQLRKQTARGARWSVAERFSGQSVTFVVIIFMSRLLSQEDFGLVGMLVIFMDVAQALADGGVSQALIRKNDRTASDCSTAFFVNVAISGIMYVLLFFTAPVIARFYGHTELVILTRILSLCILCNALMMVQQAVMTASMDFRTQAKATMISAVIGGIVGIAAAYLGAGVWAIVSCQLVRSMTNCISLWTMSSWRPSFTFSMASLRYFGRFGVNLTAAGVMHTIYKDLYPLIIGKFFQAASLGLYTRATQFSEFPSNNLNAVLQRVLYPAMCMVREEDERLRCIFLRFLRMVAFIVLPVMTVICSLSDPIVVCLVGEKWAYAGRLLAILSLSVMWIPIDTLNLSLLQVKGRTDSYLRCEIIKKIWGVAVLVVTLPFGLEALCWGQVIRTVFDLAVGMYYGGRMAGVSVSRQIMEIVPAILVSAVMAVSTYFCIGFINNGWVRLGIGAGVSAVIFIVMIRLIAPDILSGIKYLLFKRNNGLMA